MLAVCVSGLVGVALALAACWQASLPVKVVCLPLGGSLAALLCGLYVGQVRAWQRRLSRDRDDRSLMSLSESEHRVQQR